MADSQISKKMLERFQNGDSQAAKEIWSRYSRRLGGLARHRISDKLAAKVDVADILQTTFFEFFEKAKRDDVIWKQRGDLWRLLAAIALNHVRRQNEKFAAEKRDVANEQSIGLSLLAVMSNDSCSRHLEELLEATLLDEDSLTEQIVRGRLAGYTLHEIANQTERSERTIRRLLAKLKTKLLDRSPSNCSRSRPPIGEARPLAAKIADYQLLQMIGEGGFGKVYMASDLRTDQIVAVKVLHKGWIGDADTENLFLNEMKIIANLDHPNIVGFMEMGKLRNGSWFMVMDHINGPSLQNWNYSKFDSEVGASWIRQLAATLSYLHSQNVVHGDLKPQNILVENDQIQLVDFGFSNAIAGNRVQNWAGGTNGFMAPECENTFAADIYSFGKVVQFLASRTDAFEGTEFANVVENLIASATQANQKDRPSINEITEWLGGS